MASSGVLAAREGRPPRVPGCAQPALADEVFADLGQAGEVGDVALELGDGHDDVGEAGELGAQLRLAARDHRVVAERRGERAQHPGGAGGIREVVVTRLPRAPPRRGRRRSRATPPPRAPSSESSIAGSVLFEHERAEVEAARGELLAELLGLAQAARPRAW